MKKTQFIELLCTIKKTMVSFVSIAFFVLLGAGIFLGMDWSVTGFKNTVDYTLNEWNMHDVSLTFPYGFTDEIIDKVKQLDYVDEAKGQNSFEANFVYNKNRYQAKVILLTDEIDDAHRIIGEIPTKKGEIGFERFWAENNGINIGDTITFVHDDDGTAHSLYNLLNEDLDALQENKITEDGMMYLTTDTFKVTGLFENGTYINQYKVTYGVSATTSIPNDCITYVSEKSLDEKAFNGYRTIILTSHELDGLNTFDDEYKNKNNEIVDRLQSDLEPYITERNNKVFDSINNVKADIDKQVKDGEDEIAKGEKELIDAQKQIIDGEKEIEDGKIELTDAKAKLDDAKDKLDKGWAEYNAGLAEYNAGKSKTDQFDKAYDSLMEAFKVYDELLKAPEYLDSLFDSYSASLEAINAILDTSSSEAKILIKQFFSNYTKGTYDNNVDSLYNSIKEIIDADGFNELKNELNRLETSKKAEVQPLIDFVNFIDNINNELDSYKLMYELFKNKTLAGMLEGTVIEFEEAQKNKLDVIISTLRSEANSTHSEFVKVSNIVASVLSQYGPTVDDAKSLLESKVKSEIDKAKTELAKAKTQLNAGYSELSKGQREYDAGLKKYYDGIALLVENEELIEKAKKDVIDGKKKLEEGKEELEIAKNKIKDFDKKVEEIEHYDITLLGRNLNGGVASTTAPIDMMSSIKYTMVLLFIVVGIFVCYSALSRSVYDQTVQIGTKKALGLSRKEVTLSFLMYGSLATIIGCILGVCLARFIVEPLILNILAKNYIVSSSQYYFDLKSSLLFTLFELVVTNLTSFLACNKALMKKAIKLLQGPDDLIGKSHFYEKLPFWNSLSLLTKTIINNCVNDKRRVISTLVGVAGCCSLMVCAISLITNMNESLDYQLNNIAKFESIAYVDTTVDGSLDKINSKLDEMGIEHYVATYSSSAIENSKGDFISGALFIYDDDKFFDFFDVATNGKRNEVGEGVCIAKAYAQFNDIKPGDSITVLDSLGVKHDINVTTVFDYYLLRAQTVMNKDSYVKAYGKEPIKNAVLIKRGNYTNHEINDALYPIDGYITTFDYLDESVSLYASLTDSVMIIVITFFALAVVLAFLVLLNLLIMFVDEKKKELIVMMINGYSRKTVKTYIYGDTIVLTIIGILIGTVIGVVVGFATIKTFDSDCVTIMRNINIPSYLICGGLTALLSAISCLIALKKVDGFKLTEINSK